MVFTETLLRIRELRCSNASRVSWSCMLSAALLGYGCTPSSASCLRRRPQSHYLLPNCAATVDSAIPCVSQEHVSAGTIPPDDGWTPLGRKISIVQCAWRCATTSCSPVRRRTWRLHVSESPRNGAPLYPQVDAVASVQQTRLGATFWAPRPTDIRASSSPTLPVYRSLNDS